MELKSNIKNAIAMLIITLYMASVHAEDTRIKTQGDFFYYAQLEQFRAVVMYCGQKVPSNRKVLYRIYEKFLDRYGEAVQSIGETVGAEWATLISVEEAEKGMAMVREGTRKVIPQIEQAGPENFCPGFAVRLTEMTSASLANNFQSAYEAYRSSKTQ